MEMCLPKMWKIKSFTVLGILTICDIARTATVIHRTKILTSVITGCDSRYCPPEENVKDVIKHCEYNITVGYSYKCFERSSNSRVQFATPDLICEPGYYGDPKVDWNNPGEVVVEKKQCPVGYYQPTRSNCYDGCQLKHSLLVLLDNYKQFKVYSKGDSVSPTKLYCNFLLGYYSKNGKNFLNYDKDFQWVYKSFCANVDDSNPCTEGKVPLHNSSCVVPCYPGYERDVYDSFLCKKKTGTVDKPTLENGSVKENAASEGGSSNNMVILIGVFSGAGAVALVFVVVVVLCRRKHSRHNYQQADASDPPSSASIEDSAGYPFKKTVDDMLSQNMLHSIEIQMRSVGALIQNSDPVGTVFRVGKDCVMTAWHTVLPILDPFETGNLDESFLQDIAVFINFSESLICRPIKDYKVGGIVWKNVDLDVVILRISNSDDNLPLPLILWKGSMSGLGLSEVSFAGYGNPKHPNKKHLDPRCKLLDSFSDRIKSAQAWLLRNAGKMKRALIRYNKDPMSVDLGYRGYDRKEFFLVDCYVEEGSSGSPGFTNDNANSIKVVGMLTNGFPKCYHDLQEHKSELEFPDKYKFEMGVRMEHVFACMNEDNPDLAKVLFI
ncbi:uncharacterized protein LOC123533884 isoform X2 [Mercenaria mercenaria]|uniref:uncharacterized protein LOC123533884 isoform X2 n=1 Tax=Mercenaria mercenaria TaxID=6596 RepID=UPI00234FAE21|nr:uncharacterized protein LOC123533884 isoform X2 [Mercenaria mercenaria]